MPNFIVSLYFAPNILSGIVDELIGSYDNIILVVDFIDEPEKNKFEKLSKCV